jgi:hypothetical protein
LPQRQHLIAATSSAERRIAEGLTKPEAIRCVKRYVARQTYHGVRADLAATTDA